MATVKKIYPIGGRRDFFKYVILATGESFFDSNAKLRKDFKGDSMYFDDIDSAKYVCNAINRVESKRGDRQPLKAIKKVSKIRLLISKYLNKQH